MKYLRITALMILTLFTAGCAKLGVWAANAPSAFGNYEVSRDIAYGSESAQMLDVYRPEKGGNHDVIVFFYGGRWETGSRKDYRFVAEAFTSRGYVVVIPDYRHYPEVKFPGFVDDAAHAVAWVSNNIAAYGGNPARIHLAGHSAGAHIAALVTADARYLKKYDKSANKTVRSFAGLAGPYDFVPAEPDVQDIFGPPANYPNMQATTFIDGREPPMLLLWGQDDKVVGIENLQKLEARIKARKGRVQTILYPGVDHIWIAGALSWLGKTRAPVAADMDAFFKSVP